MRILWDYSKTHTVSQQPKTEKTVQVKLIIGSIILAAFALVAVISLFVHPQNPTEQDITNALAAPSATHLFGTDELGRDELSRVLAAASIDLPVALLATLLPMILGTILGLLAGYLGGWIDTIVMRISDLLQAFPMYVLMIVLVFILGPGIGSLLASFTLVGWVVYARIARGEALRVKNLAYITAAVTGGLSTPRIILKHVLPNTFKQSILYFTSDIVFAVAALATFSFLGFGIQQPTPEWGSMIAGAQPYVSVAPWLTIIPGAVLTLFALGLALVGDALQDRGGKNR